MTMSANNFVSAVLSPRVVAWESTRACKYACQHCRALAQKQADPDQLTTEEAYNMIDQISLFCKPVFIISGGDPLQREDIFDIAKYASKQGLRVVMSPSGSDINFEIMQKMKTSNIELISLSLDGSSAAVHDGFRMVLGAFDLVMQNMTLACECKMPFRINTTVTQHNLTDLPNILKLVTDSGAVEWDVFMLVPTGRGRIQMEITPKQYEETLQLIYSANLTSRIPIKVTCAPQYVRIIAKHSRGGTLESRRHHGGRGCMAGNGFCFISHIGEVYGCGFLPLKAGNIRRQAFSEIYTNSPLFKQLRSPQLLKGKCGTCDFKVVCGGCRARAFSTSGDYLQEEPFCKYVTV
ncbi:MAG: SPASM domain-containing protein [Nitrososphaerota archaeon]|nr:SPASM domain-containing protein [Nitrososphaerota archaeon]